MKRPKIRNALFPKIVLIIVFFLILFFFNSSFYLEVDSSARSLCLKEMGVPGHADEA